MTYSYPPIGATNPEETPAAPAMRYEFWVISRIANVVNQVLEQAQGQLTPIGLMTIKGRKYENVEGVINPVGDETEFTTDNLFGLFTQYPELGNSYNAFIQGFAPILEIVDNQTRLMQKNANTFGYNLRFLRDAARRLDAEEFAAKVKKCIDNYPDPWSMEDCLVYLGFIPEPQELSA